MQPVRAGDGARRKAFSKLMEERRASLPASLRFPLHFSFGVRGKFPETGGGIHAHPRFRKVSEERSSTVLMASNVLFYSGLASLAAGAGMARCGFGLCAVDGVQILRESDRALGFTNWKLLRGLRNP